LPLLNFQTSYKYPSAGPFGEMLHLLRN